MERYAWKATLKKDKRVEYVKRHDEIWQEMKDMLNDAGVRNYSIWLNGDEIFGYYECEKGVKHALKTQSESPITARWNDYMEDVMDMPLDPETGAQPHLEQVFYFDGRKEKN
jgi:L-rhamnose mutarotase